MRRELVPYAPAHIKESRLPIAKRHEPRVGRRAAVVCWTPLGEKFIGEVLPRHAKAVKALMRAVDGREQETLSRICRKLREGNILKFTSELTHENVDDEVYEASVRRNAVYLRP